MVAEAIRAGEALARAMEQQPHGKFTPWVEGVVGISIRTAQEYMKAAKHADVRAFLSDGMTLREFLYGETKAAQNDRQKAEAAATFSRDDAEYALKILAMAERGATEIALRGNFGFCRNSPPPKSWGTPQFSRGLRWQARGINRQYVAGLGR